MNIQTRIQNLVKCFKVPKDKSEKLAFRYLLSTLSAIEQIAVLAAERGAGVEGQLDDEIVHRETFKILADKCGGYEEPDDAILELLDYLDSLQGEKALAALNVVAEGWLGCVFETLAHLSPELFNSIGQDESRHNGYALSYKIPNSHELAPIISDLEYLLLKIAMGPNFMVPMIFLTNLKTVSRMGLKIKKCHDLACLHLNVQPNTREYEKLCKASLKSSSNTPEEIPMNKWQTDKHKIWDSPHDMISQREIKINIKNEIRLQAKIVEALYHIMSIEPKFRNVTRNNKLYRVKRFLIGIRTRLSDDELVTLYVSAKNNYKDVVKSLISKIKMVKRKGYGDIPSVLHLKQLIPPSQCPITISYIGEYGAPWGFTRLGDIEGASIGLFVGAQKNDKYLITIVMDHRVFDGRDLALFGHLLEKYLQEG